MEFYPTANQKGADLLDLRNLIDVNDLLILDMLSRFSSWEGCKSMVDNGSTYYLFSWKLVGERIPYSPVKSRSAVYARYRKLCEVFLLEAHPDNQSSGRPWYRFGDNYGIFIGAVDPSLKKTGCPSSETGVSGKKDGGCPSSETGGVRLAGHNEYNYMSVTSNELNENEETQSVPDVKTQVNGKKKKKPSPSSASPLPKSKTWGKNWATYFDKTYRGFVPGSSPYQFDNADFGHFKRIRSKLVGVYKSKYPDNAPDEDVLFEAFCWLCLRAVALDPWFKNNWKPVNLANQFNKIVQGKTKSEEDVSDMSNYFKSKYGNQ